MRLLKHLFILIGLASAIICRAQPINADIIVDINGSGDYTAIQAAIDASPSNSEISTVIYIKRGLYHTEKLIVPADKKNITFVGESREETIISYDIYNCNDGGDGVCPDEKAALWTGDNIRTAATLTVMADDFRAENLTIENTAGPVGQAQAITMRGDRGVFINCNLTGYQDTIYFWGSDTDRNYFENCLVVGRTDYIYGNGIAFFNECEIRSWGGGWITAPSTSENTDYGYVFYKCELTYADNSPRSGDDGALIRFGRPWHNYPKVAWLYCDMTEYIHPDGWGDKWNMDYSDTDTRLHLYEYQNTGAGADMSNRADWAGLRALTDEEAPLYEPEVVLAGSDNWDPTATPPAVTVYSWTGGGLSSSWLTAENWDPATTPGPGEAANVDGETITADGGTFVADLNLLNSATLDISSGSTVTLLSFGNSTISSSTTTSFAGTIRTKDLVTLDVSGDLTLSAKIIGVHDITKKGSGTVTISAVNDGFAGQWIVDGGILNISSEKSAGAASAITVKTDGTIQVGHSNAVFPTTALYTEGDAQIVLDADLTISEWYIDGVIQDLGEYSASTNASIISGNGKITIGRPSQFTFIGGDNGNWDNAAHFSPALLPEAGETVIVAREIEAQGSTFLGNMIIESGGSIRLRSGNSICEGTITMKNGTHIGYATGGTGFTLHAPIILDGDIFLNLNSANTAGSIMDLPGSFEGDHKVSIRNTRSGAMGPGTLKLSGDNTKFTGIWDLNTPSATTGAITAIDGAGENAFGKGEIEAASINEVIFNHKKCAGDTLNLTLTENAKAVLNVDVAVNELTLNGTKLDGNATYDASTHPNMFSGTGSIMVDIEVVEPVFFDLNISVTGSGSVEAEDSYEEGTEITLTAEPEEGWEFAGWSGDVEGSDATITFTITAETNLTATFTEIESEALSSQKVNKAPFYVQQNRLVLQAENNGLRIYSLTGQQLLTENENTIIDLSTLKPGVYIMRYNIGPDYGSTRILIK